MRALVVYFSLDGSTRFIAENLAQAIQADLEELKPDLKLPTGNFAKHFWGGRMVIFREKPVLAPLVKNISDYDLIIIGTPVWMMNFSPPVRTFLHQNKFSGKKVALFCCCDGMAGKTIENMKKELAGNEFIGDLVLEKTSKNREENLKRAVDWVKKLV
jgi:flavodoxin